MTERPILFSGPMVRALLDGRKTQTRRIVRSPEKYTRIRDCGFACPYGVPGDRLWGKETWGFDRGVRHDFRPIGPRDLSGMDLREHLLFRADRETGAVPRWRPSIFMPRWASRLTLEIAEVRVQRLQEITEEDAKAEGADCRSDLAWGGGIGDDMPRWAVAHGYSAHFQRLWDEINGKRAGAAWADSPWVWAITFRRVTP